VPGARRKEVSSNEEPSPPPKKKETRANAQMFETKDYELVLKYEKKTHQESKSNRYD
jgi:hypothetical protein